MRRFKRNDVCAVTLALALAHDLLERQNVYKNDAVCDKECRAVGWSPKFGRVGEILRLKDSRCQRFGQRGVPTVLEPFS